jgi:hypothetical protein
VRLCGAGLGELEEEEEKERLFFAKMLFSKGRDHDVGEGGKDF